MPYYSIDPTNLIDAVNVIASGPTSIGNNAQGIVGNPPGDAGFVYFTNNIAPYSSTTLPSPPPDTDAWIATDCFGVVTITQPNNQVFLSSQLRAFFGYSGSGTFRFYVGINRYPYPDYRTQERAELVYLTTAWDTSGGLDPAETFEGDNVISTFIDTPGLGQWQYYLEFYWEILTGNPTPTYVGADVRSLTASVVVR
jgi:hypothetical protein